MMLPVVQRTHVLLASFFLMIATNFPLQAGGTSKDIIGSCTFDESTFCSWSNERYTDHFDWVLGQGSSPGSDTGPITDYAENGSYIYIQTLSPRKYNEKARLKSPWMWGPLLMTFFYSMYGSTIETLSVYVRVNGSESRIWSRHGNRSSRHWIEGCVAINYEGTYQVVIEGIAGVTSASSIAVDELNFSENLTCVSDGDITPSELFKVNCTFKESFCGWRNLFAPSDQIDWRRGSENSSGQIEASGNLTVSRGRKCIYIESHPDKVYQTAQLSSPFLRGPKCFRFSYRLPGRDVGRLDVLLQLRGRQGDYLMWNKSGDQGSQRIMASVDIGYTDDFQIVLQATVGKNYTSHIAVYDVNLVDGLCHDERELSTNVQGNCNFDRNLCFWRKDLNFIFAWRRKKGRTKSPQTGPSRDHTSGSGYYIYIETSGRRKMGDTARLTSPWLRGPHCMMFYYHMHGSSMGCVVLYIRRQAADRLQPLWLRSKKQGNKWIQGQVSINDTSSYQIIIDGIRGRSSSGDAALDDFTFQHGHCHQLSKATFYVSSTMGKDFRISTRPSEDNRYSDEFRFSIEHPQGNPTEKTFFIYPYAKGHSFVTTKLDIFNYNNYPLDVAVLNHKDLSLNCSKIFFISRDRVGPMITLEDPSLMDGCKCETNFFFYACNVVQSESRSISGCEPGWYKLGKACFMFYFQSSKAWRIARNLCHKQKSEIAIVNSAEQLEALADQRKKLKRENRGLTLGLDSKLRWVWIDGENAKSNENLWGPNEPSGDGKCGAFLNAIEWNSNWAGYGWRWNDISCTSRQGYICEEPLDVPLPVALFSTSRTNGVVNLSPNGTTKAVSDNITLTRGPWGNPVGSFLFSGLNNSYVEVENEGELDTTFSMSVFAWVHPDASATRAGPIYDNGCSMWVFPSTWGLETRYMVRDRSKIHLLRKDGVIKINEWNFIGTTYDYHTGVASVWVNDSMVMSKSLGSNVELATQGNLTIGASNNRETQFYGKVSCLQFYAQALSVDQIMKIKTRCNQTISQSWCRPGFFPLHGGCYFIHPSKELNWQQSLRQCNRSGGTLAKITREGLRSTFSNLLEEIRRFKPYYNSFFIGLLSKDEWTWMDGSPLHSSLWKQGYPKTIKKTRSCGYLAGGSSGIRSGACTLKRYPLCQKKAEESLSNRSLIRCSSILQPFQPILAIDGSYSTCSRSLKESNPWWQATFNKLVYVVSVSITDKIDCCPRDSGIIDVSVTTSQTGLSPTCSKSMAYDGTTHEFIFDCSPPALGNNVKITLTGDNVTLVLCHVVVETIESTREVHGVLREGWYNKYDYNSKKTSSMPEYPLIQGPPESRIILRDFDAPINLAENYVQRLTSYLQVSLSGNHTFYAACDDMCELWKYDVTETGIGGVKIESGESVTNQPIIYVKKWTEYLRWDKYPEQKSQPIVLSKCRFYRMVIFGREKDGNDHISVGMRNPNGEYERPITGERLFWTKPGTRNLEMSLKNHKTSISAFVGSNLLITGYYKFCCEGVYCPDCPLELNISCLGQNLKVNSAVILSCVNTSFEVVFNTIVQPGNFTLKASYSFVQHPEEILEERVLGQVDLSAMVLEECYFESGKCDWTSPHANSKWKLFPDNFVYINGPYKAELQSPVLLWEPFHQVVGLCLRFTYLIPVKSKSTIKVLLREPRKEEPILAWQLSRYHGTKWSVAEVSLPGATAVQIIFEGEGFLHNQVNAAIKNVIVTTEKCGLLPYFAKPGFSCGNKQFQCKNGECVKKNLRCDGDFACTDDSDEDNCECPSNKFACLDGKCLPASAVCNGINDCSNGDDENNCRNRCPFKHHCLDGSCIAWSETCIREPFCKDGTNTPSVCGSGKCRLNDLACSSKESKGPIRCKSFRRFCNFENDLCQLNPDMNATFQWITGAGETPTEKTGPSYDHSTLSKDGSYIYIEASPQRPGDVARLLSEWMEPNQSACVQFWYHMYGSDIGNLSFYLRTDQSETLVWRLSSDQGDRWKFGQFSLISERAHRFVIEGTTGDGSEGDIAIDDMSVLDGNCKKIIAQDSPDCSFREDTCDWETREGWTLSKHSPDPDLQNYGPGVPFIFLRAGASEVPHTLSSPVINTNEWKCLRLWYFIGATNLYKTSLQVFLQSLISNLSTLLFFVDEMASATNYTQIPLPGNYSKAKLKFFGIYEEFGDQILAIEQVSFSKEPCDPISWRQNDINKPLGMQNGEIVDTQISSSSSMDEAHAASRGRLHLNATSGKAGAWSAGRNDNSQWLQVDLRNNNVRVTGVATQGRNGRYAQWVTNYKLQYSNDGVNFQFYKKPEHTALEDFAGNKDQDSVVYHELKLPIRARFIRFQPEAWHRQISMRVELYGHQKECQKALGMEDNGISDGQIRASSSWNGNSVASRGRLSIKASGRMRGSWTASAKNSHQWLQIDLGTNDNIVTGVATQGSQDTDQWVTSYKLQYGNDGFNFQYYKDQNEDKDFSGNRDRDTVVFHELKPPISARFVRFLPEAWQNHISMRVELYGCLDECQEALGMKNGAIPDRQISASSDRDNYHAAWQGRLDYKGTWKAGSWSSRRNDIHQWLQIDLYSPYMKVTGIATQGRNGHDQWMTRYTLWYSNDGRNFQPHKEAGERTEKNFDGNRDRDTIVYNRINPPVKARYIQIRPQAWYRHISMRTELYGCLEDVSGVSINISDCQQALGMENGAIADAQITAFSIWNDHHAASQARLEFKANRKKSGAWSASRNNVQQWLQVDLGSQYAKVTRVGTQGRDEYSQWVIKYKLQSGNDEAELQFYKERGTNKDKEFDGNSDRSTIVFHELEPPIKARFVRFRPQDWFNRVSMRIELYGCRECQEPLGLGNSSITDGQLSSSSQLDDAHTAMQGRLNSNATGGTGGSWSAGNNNSSQWLQIDLLDQSNNVTRVATQGRHDASQWVTKYRLQYSEDGKIFHFYREPGDTAGKVFDGNEDQNSIAYNELDPPITARFIRFQPVSWYGHISMRVELYGCQDDRPCETSMESCGWNITRGWKRMKYRDLDNIGSDADDEGIINDENYEIHFPDSSRGYVSFSDIRQAKGGFTICFWLKTSNVGFFIEYRTVTSGDQNETLVFGLYCGNNTFDILLRNHRSQYSMGMTDDSWHYVCVLLDGNIGLLAVFKDGHRNFKEARRRAPNSEYWNAGTMTVGFRKTNNSNSAVLGKLSGLNIWSYPVSITEILSMSYGCGTEAGDSKSWETVRDKIIGEVEIKDSRTCKDRKASRLVAEGITVHVNQSALFMSPLYDASRGGQSRCLRFRYMLQGPGEKALTVYRKARKYREIPIWISKGITRGNWVYGQVQLSSISDFQVLIKAEMGRREDLIALTGLYIDEGKNCRVTPLSAKKACSENLINETGYFFSPSYPGNPPDDTYCKWHITVQKNHIIRLEFQEFLLTNHPTCERCFLQIFDGRDLSANAIGKFCGDMHPPVVISSSSHFTIVFRCVEGLRMTRFKAFYHSTRTQYWEGSSCSLHRECPSSCKCKEFGEVYDKRILIIGEKLLAIPSNLPPNTGAVVFRQNRILQLHEKEFSDLTILEHIDLSFNNLLHLDEECFHNVSSVTTLRLNSNFLRILPIGVFSELPNLKVLDLGSNLLSSMRSGMFDALSNLNVLGLRANQLTNLQYGVFGNKSDMTHLYLQENKLTALPNGLFKDLSKVEVLNLSSNELKTVTKETLQGLSALKYLYLDNNRLANVPTDAFSELTSLKYLKLDHFILCCYAEKSVEGVTCDSPADEFSSCDDLMKNKTLQICIWILGILAFLGNLLVITWRIIDKEENRVNSFLLTNLAVADMFMGVYLLTIAIVDARWQGEYFKHDTKWRAGIGCQVIGVLSMLSSEVSVLILTVITIDRFVCIIFPFKFKRLTYKSAVFICAVVWILGVVISMIPIIGMDYFYDKSGDFGFYSRSAVCLPLQLSEGTPAGWEYSASFFIGLNSVSFTFILVAYILMFWTVKRSARAVRSTSMNKESAMAKRLVFIVMTDFCCWMPIIIISILSLTGNFFDPHKIAFVWIAVFVLPLNSSLNPILYTFSTERAKRSLARKRKNVTGMVMKSLNSRAGDQSMDCLRTNAENTLVFIAESSPRPVKKIVEKQEQQSKQVKTKLKLIEVVDIFQEDTTGKRSTGYVTAWCEEEGVLGMVLLKYFGKEMKEDWTREVDVVQGLSSNEDPQDNLLHYRWHSKASEQSIEHGKKKIHGIQGSSWLICYDFESSSTLGDFLSEKGIVIDLDAVCAVVCDVITAIEHLLDHGIAHNNITTGNILIRQCPRVPPIKAVLGGFSQASKANDAGAFTNSAADEQSCHSHDIKQFGHLLATLLGYCHGSSEYVKLREIMNLCFEDTEEKRPTARYIREVLEETWRVEGVWDT